MSNKDAIAKLRAEADALEAADKAFNELPEEHRLAITLHGMLCRANHMDGCGWEYEYLQKPFGWEGPSAPDWNGHAHGRYLQKALVMKGFCKQLNIPTDKAIELIKIIKEL